MAKYTVIHPTRAIIFKDGSYFRRGQEVDLSASSKRRIQQLIDQGYIAATDSTEAKAAVKAANADNEQEG